MNYQEAKKIMKKNFIGPDELSRIAAKLGIADPRKAGKKIPPVRFSEAVLKKNRSSCLLILGVPVDRKEKKLTINVLRFYFGSDPAKSEPCFYNQDWYLKEKFAGEKNLKFAWYLISKIVKPKSRAKTPEFITKELSGKQSFPLAILTAFAFFAYYFHTGGELLWRNDFIWCSDLDSNKDRIYAGRYIDPKGISKNGFNIHRHLRVRPSYGLAPVII